VVHVDSFGNLATNLTAEHIPASAKVKLQIAGMQVDGMAQTFSDRPSGALTALLDSSGAVSIVMVNGSAAQLLDVGVGEPVTLIDSI
jgi:S-adenosylmethionine hydrolase